jgi:hypothetical protein
VRRALVSVLTVSAVAAVLFTMIWVVGGSANSRSEAAVDQGSLFHLIDPPNRIFDSRKQLILEAPGSRIPSYNACQNGAGGVTDYPIFPLDSYFCLGVGSQVPTSATAVLFNVTVTDSDGPGYIQLVTGNAVPGSTSHVNKQLGETVANQVTVALDASRSIMVVNQGSSTHIIFDLEGYYVPSP